MIRTDQAPQFGMHMIRILICQCTHSSDFKPKEEEEEVKDNWISYSWDVFQTAHEHRADSSFVSLSKLHPPPAGPREYFQNISGLWCKKVWRPRSRIFPILYPNFKLYMSKWDHFSSVCKLFENHYGRFSVKVNCYLKNYFNLMNHSTFESSDWFKQIVLIHL